MVSSSRSGSCQRIEDILVASWNKLGISKALVVTTIAQELGSVFEELLQFFIRDTSFLLQSLPVAICGFAELDYEVEDAFGLGGDLTESNSGSRKGSSEMVVSFCFADISNSS